jgi:nicotinate-nucleotide adenylyltransferase
MIGIFGGRFDPVHRAHLAMARAAADQLQLQEVLWVVSANAVHKSIVASAEHRLEMVRLALEELKDPRMKVDEREIYAAARGEANPSFKTLQSLQEERPNQEWVWILGEDQLQAFTSWQRWEWLTQNMALAVCRRPGGYQATDLPALTATGARVIPIKLRADAVSSSQIRENLAQGLSIQTLVPPSVASYLAAHALYCPPEAAGASQHPNSV